MLIYVGELEEILMNKEETKKKKHTHKNKAY